MSWHLDTAGLFGAGVADVAFAAAAVLDRDLRVDRGAPAAPRIALTRTHLWPQASAAMQNAVETAGRIAAAAGAKVTELTLPPLLEDAYEAQFTIQDYENIRALAFEYERHRERDRPTLARSPHHRHRDLRRRIRRGAPHRQPRAGKCSPTRWRITT